jgi:HD-GYP domain-containing protein (c-di-GMP phosphodiesterase class II)
MATVRVPIYELQIGMYVAKLDLSWFRSPLLRHSFLIEQASQVERLVRAGVKWVEIDPARGKIARPVDTMTTVNQAIDPPDDTVSPVPLKPHKSLAQLNEEYAQASLAKKQLEQAVNSVFSTIAKTGSVTPQQASEAVQEITIVTRTLTNSAMFMALSQHRNGDPTLSHHALATCSLSLVLGQAFHLNPLELQELATAALLHDIGLVQIAASTIQRARATSTPLTAREQQQFQTHPRLSAQNIQRQGGYGTSIPQIIAQHHSYPDGSGYPTETSSAYASDRARMLMVADAYDELITGFGGASPLAPHQALQRLYIEAQQNRFDLSILSRFISLVGIYPVHSCVRLNTNELATVTALNPTKLHQPLVAITHEPGGATYPVPLIVDLACQEGQPQQRVINAVLKTTPNSISTSTRAA